MQQQSTARVAGHFIKKLVDRNQRPLQQNTAKVAGHFVRHIVPAIAKPAMALWNEVIGFIFICLGVILGANALRYGRRGETFQVVVCGIAALLMAFYGVSSFRRARKISRS